MHDNHHETSPESLRRRHEQSDISAKGIVTFLAFLTLATGFTAFLMVLLFWFFQEQETANDMPPSPLALRETVAPEPRLQALPSIDLKQMREHDQVMLNEYGWVRREAQVVRVPVEQGMQMLLKRGLPAFPIIPLAEAQVAAPAPTADVAAPTTAAAPEAVAPPASAPSAAVPEDAVAPPVTDPVATEAPVAPVAPEVPTSTAPADANAGAAQ